MLKLGCHLPISKGFFEMGKQAASIDANTIQFFTRNPRGGAAKPINEEDVNKAVSEAIRVTKPGGKIFFAYITNEAVIFNYGLKKGHLKEIEEMCDDNFKVPNIPEEIFAVRYIKDFNKTMSNYKNIKKLKELATDGIAGGIGAIYVNELSDEEFKIWINYHLATCEREDLMGCSNHILYIAEKI